MIEGIKRRGALGIGKAVRRSGAIPRPELCAGSTPAISIPPLAAGMIRKTRRIAVGSMRRTWGGCRAVASSRAYTRVTPHRSTRG